MGKFLTQIANGRSSLKVVDESDPGVSKEDDDCCEPEILFRLILIFELIELLILLLLEILEVLVLLVVEEDDDDEQEDGKEEAVAVAIIDGFEIEQEIEEPATVVTEEDEVDDEKGGS